jgi:hypothetical protein
MELSRALQEAIKQFQDLLHNDADGGNTTLSYMVPQFATVAGTAHQVLDKCLLLEQQSVVKCAY